MSTITISSGQTSSGLTITSGNQLIVLSGGTAAATTIASGGSETLSSGGTTSGTVISGGGVLIAQGLLAGRTTDAGKISGGSVIGGGALSVTRGGTATAMTVLSGGAEVVLSGGLASGTVVSGGGTEIISSGGVLAYNGGSTTFSGSLQGGGTLAVTANAFTYAGPAGSSDVGVVVQGGTLTLKTSETFGRGFTFSSGGSAVIASGQTLTIGGSADLTGGQIDGPGTLVTTGATSVYDTLTATLFLDGSLTWVNSGTVSDGEYSIESDQSGSGSIIISNTASGVFDLLSGGSIDSPYDNAETFINAGTLAAIGGESYVYPFVSNTGMITVASGDYLQLAGGGSFGGSIGGAGEIAFGFGTDILSTGHADTFGDLAIQSAVVSSTDSINVTGTFFEDDGSLTLGSGASFSAGDFEQYGGTLSLATNTTLADAKVGGTIDLHGTTLTLTGSTDLSFAEIIGRGVLDTAGATTFLYLYLDGGLTWVNSGTVVTDKRGYVDPSGSGSIVISNTASGVFDLNSGGEIESSGGTETFMNAGTLAQTSKATAYVYATVNNTGTLTATSGTLVLNAGGTLAGTLGATNTKGVVLLGHGAFTTVAGTAANLADDGTATGLILASGETWTDAGSIRDSGRLHIGNVTGGSVATLAIASGGTFTLTGADSRVVAVGTATITNAGTITQNGPTGLDTIAINISNTGLIDAATGTLDLTGAVAGTGAMQIDAGASLELGATLSSTQTVTFNGSGAKLILEKPETIKLLKDFGVGDRIDLAGFTATAAGTSGDVLTVTSRSTSYTFTSNESLASGYARYESDGKGGTLVTLYADAAASKTLNLHDTPSGADTNLFVKLDSGTVLSLGSGSFITAEGATTGLDRITAGGVSQTLESLGGSNTIDITDVLYTALKPLTYGGNATSGTLGITDGAHKLTLTMTGSYTLGSFAPGSDGHGGTLITFV